MYEKRQRNKEKPSRVRFNGSKIDIYAHRIIEALPAEEEPVVICRADLPPPSEKMIVYAKIVELNDPSRSVKNEMALETTILLDADQSRSQEELDGRFFNHLAVKAGGEINANDRFSIQGTNTDGKFLLHDRQAARSYLLTIDARTKTVRLVDSSSALPMFVIENNPPYDVQLKKFIEATVLLIDFINTFSIKTPAGVVTNPLKNRYIVGGEISPVI